MVANITRHVVPADAFTTHPHLYDGLTRLDTALTVAYTALTGPSMPDPVVTMHTNTLPARSSRKRFHWGAACEEYRAVKARTTVTARMSEMYGRECRSCRIEAPSRDGTDAGLVEQIECHWSAQSLWAQTGHVLARLVNGHLESTLQALTWDLRNIGRSDFTADVLDTFVDVVAAAHDLTDPTGIFLREPRNADSLEAADAPAGEVARSAATVTAAARLAGHFAWTQDRFLSYEEGQPWIDLDLRVLGIHRPHPALVEDPTQPNLIRPPRLEPVYTAWLAALEVGSGYTEAAAAGRAAYGDLPEPRLSQLPDTFPITGGAEQITLSEMLAHWAHLAERALASVFTEWARSAQAELDRWAVLDDVDIVISTYMTRDGLRAISSALARTFPTRYDRRVRSLVVTVPAVVAGWLDRPMTRDRSNLWLVPARRDTPEIVDTFRRLRGSQPHLDRSTGSRMSVEDALMAARAIHSSASAGPRTPEDATAS